MRWTAVFLIMLLVLGLIPLSVLKPVTAAVPPKTVQIVASADAYSSYKYGKYYRWYSYHEYKGKYELALGNTSYYAKQRSYFRFDLSEVPSVASIQSARVCVYVAYIKYFSTPMNIGIYNITNHWNENYTNPAPEPEQLLYNTTLQKGWVCFDVTNYIKSRFPAEKTFSFVLKLVNESISNYAWLYSRENSYDKPYMEVAYQVPVAVSSLTVSGPYYTSSPIGITSTITNGGESDVQLTYVLTIDNRIVKNKTITVPGGGQVEETYTWFTTETGLHTVKAEIRGEGFSDTASTVVNVQYNPYILFASLARLYANLFEKEYPGVQSLYENFTGTVDQLQKCGVDLGDIKGEVKAINEEYAEMQREYQRYLKIRESPLFQHVQYSYPITLHIRKALFLGRDVERGIKKALPVLQRTLERVLPSCTAPAGNQTSNQTNTTASNVTIAIPKVLIDLSHDQYYLSKYGYQGLVSDIENELGWNVEVNLKPLTYDRLKDYDVLILTNPKEPLTSEEIEAIREFVKNGGGLIVAGDWYNHVNTESLNELLQGTGIRFEKTELMDDEENSGKPYYPFVGIYNRNCLITKLIPEGWKVYYNGDTLIVGGSAVWVIRGFDSSYAVDADGNTVYEKGSEPVVAAAATFGKGRIVAYGSSKAFSDAYYSRYIRSNWPFLKGALLWLVGQS
ncbi:DUF4350 domain-containing protein [Thermococcus sp.]|uniref:DUF4350 domain-containing protein n=1 Tax=Thermococcus sp. TaxID=35749 RepID=UPI002610D337|nr:DUF4350 domain-containing protein [Thermococcus sp.]